MAGANNQGKPAQGKPVLSEQRDLLKDGMDEEVEVLFSVLRPHSGFGSCSKMIPVP